MKENKLRIVLDSPVHKVFEFTVNPKNTPLWIPSIVEEVTDEYPPQLNTKYKNRGESGAWDEYKVIALKTNELFTLADSEENYRVQYSYRALEENKTEMEYFEWVNTGDLSKPFTQDILENLRKFL